MSHDLIVIGLGAMGSATVDAAAQRGLRVVGFEAFGRGHDRGSSHGPTRMLRRAVEEGPQYVPLVLDALPRWFELQENAQQPIITLCGAIRIAPIGSDLHRNFLDIAGRFGFEAERLSATEVEGRFPAFTVPDDYEGTFEPEAGVLFAANAVRALQDRAASAGAELHFDHPVLSWAADGDGVIVRTADGDHRADRLVITAGSWTARLATDLALPLVVERIANVSFEPADRTDFAPAAMPAFIVIDGRGGHGGDGVYGMPAVDGQGVKLGGNGRVVDPDDPDRSVLPAEIDVLRGYVDRFMPRASGPVSSSLTCLYTVAPDGHFVIDRHPEHPQVVIASPCSGHGFKYTTAIGPLLVDLAVDGSTRIPIDGFSVSRFTSA